MIITDYLYNFIDKNQRKKFITSPLEEKLSTVSEEVQSININKKISKVADSYRIKIPANIAAVRYLKLIQENRIKEIIATAVDKNDLKAALIIDNLYNKLNQEETEEILNQKNNLEEKAIDLLTLHYTQKALEILANIQKKAVDMESKLSAMLNDGSFNQDHIERVSYIMQQTGHYLRDCKKYKKSEYLVGNKPEIKNTISLLNKIKSSVQGQITHRNREIMDDIVRINKDIKQANNMKLNTYKKRLNIYLKELELIRKTNILYK